MERQNIDSAMVYGGYHGGYPGYGMGHGGYHGGYPGYGMGHGGYHRG
ncbi:hypothetical protein [Niallia sp. NCCP-28]|nr:hypothetical protein [Niallia sp. NCCP-28]GKU84113.1 hypothetical protein NCCP28_35090 [Niallia sp. NCCP-28]